jgi:hypothetical protein
MSENQNRKHFFSSVFSLEVFRLSHQRQTASAERMPSIAALTMPPA